MIDSHCHLADPQFADDLDAVLERAQEAGVTQCITIADTLEEAEKCVALAVAYDELWATVGIHPHHAKDWGDTTGDRLLQLLHASPKVKAVGEIGLDYHYDHSPREIQRDVFGTQLEIARDLNLPAVVHCREAIVDVRKIIQEVRPPRVVIHCCTEKWEDVQTLVAMGHFLSFTGIATYPTSADIRRTIEMCPIDQLMIETDAPYLAPVPYRGKRNEPAYVVEVAKIVAQIKGLPLAEIDAITTRNTVEFFGL